MNTIPEQIILEHCGAIEERVAACGDLQVAEYLKQTICQELQRRISDASLLKNIETHIDKLIDVRFSTSNNNDHVMTPIQKNIPIEELITRHPFSVHILMRRGIKCIVCGEPIWGTLEDAAKEKGLSDQEVDRIVKEINEKI